MAYAASLFNHQFALQVPGRSGLPDEVFADLSSPSSRAKGCVLDAQKTIRQTPFLYIGFDSFPSLPVETPIRHPVHAVPQATDTSERQDDVR